MKYSDFYLAFEDQFRGSSKDVNEKLVFYDGFLQEIISRFPQCKLLDIGCGRGEWLIKCTDLGINSIGIDNNESMLDICLEKGLNIKYGEALEILKTCENNSFHIISSFHFIEHISFEMFLEILDQCKRILVPGGALIFETPSIDNILVSLKDFYLDPTHLTHFHPETVIFALNYFEFTDSKYFLINAPSNQTYGLDSINNVLNGAGLDVSIIATYKTNPDEKSLLDNSLSWITDLHTAKNTFETSNIYDLLIKKKIEKLTKQIDLLNRQVDTLFFIYKKIVNSLPFKLFRKLKSFIHYIKAISLKIVKLSVSKILKIYLFEKVYYKIYQLLYDKKLHTSVNSKNDNYLSDFFKSDSRAKDILLDIKSKLKR